MYMLNVCDFGIIGDGTTNQTEAIKKVIAIAEAQGGGTVYFPPGRYLTGTVELCDNMTLYLDAGAVILGSPDPADYPMMTAEILPGYTRGGHSGLIKAFRRKNVAICGRGTIDGQGAYWWDNPGNEHRPRAIQPILCDNVLIDGITVINSAMWTIHPLCCTNVTVHAVTIKNPWDSPNTDGINPESCLGVHISNCTIDVGDDCLTLKSGTEEDILQKQYPCENIVITNCTMLNGHGGVVLGSEMSGGIRNVTISNCVFSGTDRGIRIKTRRKRGGSVSDVVVSNIVMERVFVPFVINGYYCCGQGVSPEDMSLFSLEPLKADETTPVIENISISNIRATKVSVSAGFIYGIPEQPVKGLSVSNYSVEMLAPEEAKEEAPIMAFHIGKLKGCGIYLANIRDSVFRDISVCIRGGVGMELVGASGIRVGGFCASGADEALKMTACEACITD